MMMRIDICTQYMTTSDLPWLNEIIIDNEEVLSFWDIYDKFIKMDHISPELFEEKFMSSIDFCF